MSRLIESEHEFNELLAHRQKMLVLFYASWCPFSSMFLPLFEEHARDREENCSRVLVDDLSSLEEEYGIEVVPTVLYFEKGKLKKRLNGLHGRGLDETQLQRFIGLCGLEKT
jgi:thioredoxin-like negative regulator of GroEL